MSWILQDMTGFAKEFVERVLKDVEMISRNPEHGHQRAPRLDNFWEQTSPPPGPFY